MKPQYKLAITILDLLKAILKLIPSIEEIIRLLDK